jgi:hypothetical protein
MLTNGHFSDDAVILNTPAADVKEKEQAFSNE